MGINRIIYVNLRELMGIEWKNKGHLLRLYLTCHMQIVTELLSYHKQT